MYLGARDAVRGRHKLQEIEEIHRAVCEHECPEGHGRALYYQGRILPDGPNLLDVQVPFGASIDVVFVKHDEWPTSIPVIPGRGHRFADVPRTTEPEFWDDVVKS